MFSILLMILAVSQTAIADYPANNNLDSGEFEGVNTAAKYGTPYGVPYGVPAPVPVPLYGVTPWCGKVEAVTAAILIKLKKIAEPIIIGIIAIALFWIVKWLIYPKFGFFPYFHKRSDFENRLNQITNNVINYIDKSICIENIVCTLGQAAKKYPLLDIMESEMEWRNNTESQHYKYLDIFKKGAFGNEDSCKKYKCI